MSKLARICQCAIRLPRVTGHRTLAWNTNWACQRALPAMSVMQVAPARGYAVKKVTSVVEEPEMFCYQCEQTKLRKGCSTIGVCGKTPQVAALQDLLVYTLQGLAIFANRAAKKGIVSQEVNDFTMKALFSTLTNVNFDADRFPAYIETAIRYRNFLRDEYCKACGRDKQEADKFDSGPGVWEPPNGFSDIESLENEGHKVGILAHEDIYGPDVNGVRNMIIYGIKGLSAYACHAWALGERDPWVPKFIFEALDFLTSGKHEDRDDLGKNLELALKVGDTNLRVMELLDRGHRRQFGVPSPATVSTKPKVGKCILVSGHDLMDLRLILDAAERTNVNVYTHGELMPAHGYPELRKYKSLAGHFGGAWQNQKFDFAAFPGPVVVTTNCVIEPLKAYRERLYTINECGINGVKHLNTNKGEDLQTLIGHAQLMEGFTQQYVDKVTGRDINVGFGREAILGNADKVLEAIQTGELQRVFVIGGCDGSENKRNYFTMLADSLPKETLILTMGCAKYRINFHDYGTLGSSGIPRLLDLGQCNDSYGAVMIAKALANTLGTDINSLPLSISLSWFEQKAIAVLLSLLSLGVKNIHIGPVMPAFLTPKVRDILQDKFNIIPVDVRHPVDDMKTMMGSK